MPVAPDWSGARASGEPGRPRAAFFDLDKTLIPGSSLYLLARGLHASDNINFRLVDIVRFGWGQAAFQLRGESDKDLGRSRRASLQLVAGRSQQELRAWCADIARQWIVPRVYQGMRRIIQEHADRGDATLLVTAAPTELAETVADQLGMSGAIGTTAEVDDEGRYTGDLLGPVLHGRDKAQAVAERARRLGLSLIDSSAYSDSHNDLPLLELVGHPHAVNPARQLKRLAAERDWPIEEMRAGRKALAASLATGAVAAGVIAGLATRRRRLRRRARGSRLERAAAALAPGRMVEVTRHLPAPRPTARPR